MSRAASSTPEEPGSEPPRAWRRRVLGWVGAALTALALGFGSMSEAHADQGRPAGWAHELATGHMEMGRVTLRYQPHLEEQAAWLSQNLPTWWSEIEQALAGDISDDLKITFVDHAGRVADATGMPKWAAGVASPSRGEIIIARHGPDGSPTDLESLVKHEMAHVALHRATDGATLPRWFHEGVAESFENNISLQRAQTLAMTVFGSGVPSLEGLEEQFHQDDGRRASAAYAASRDLVTHLRFRDGSGSDLRQLLTELRLGHEFEASFVRAYGMALPELFAEWREGLPARFIWYPLIAGGGMPLAVVFPLIVAAWVRRRRVLARGWARLEQQEALEREQLLGTPATA